MKCLCWLGPHIEVPINHQTLAEALPKIAQLEIDPVHASRLVEELLADPDEQTCLALHDALHSACWGLLASGPTAQSDLVWWRRVFTKASLLLSARGKDSFAHRAAVLAEISGTSFSDSANF